jgi:hypothetical protein
LQRKELKDLQILQVQLNIPEKITIQVAFFVGELRKILLWQQQYIKMGKSLKIPPIKGYVTGISVAFQTNTLSCLLFLLL